MKKAVKVIGKILLGILILLILVILCVFLYNRIMLSKEKTLLQNQQISQLVSVDGHQMSLYVSGEGKHTLVFMAGAGTPAPILSYQSFAECFQNDYRIVIIEKFGYGFSDEFEGARDVETRVNQNRKALETAGIAGPYVLCPHSYTGLETIYWAQNYPDEVEAVIGLDMAVPRAYDTYDEDVINAVKSSDSVKRILRNMGIVRLFVGGTIPADYTSEEKKIITALVCKNYGSQTAFNEVESLASDLVRIDSKKNPDVPTLLIISDGKVTDGWIGFEMDYASALSDVKTVQLDCGHSVYEYEPDKCEKSMREFIKGLEDQS